MSIKIGDKCPAFSLPNQDGEMVSIYDLIGSKIVVLYFYPKDNTWGCTKQACSFQENQNQFEDLQCEIVGISSDSVLSHKTFAEAYQLKFTLLSDIQDEARRKFGVPKSFFGLIKGRVTYIIDKSGIVQGIFNSQINSVKHISEAIKMVNLLK